MSVFLCYHLSLCFLNKDSFPPLDGGVKCSFGVRVESSRQHSGVHRIYECVSRVCARVHIVVVTLGKFWSFGNPDSRTVMAAQPIWVVFFHCTFCHLIGTSLVVWLVICTYYVMMHSNNEVVNFVFYSDLLLFLIFGNESKVLVLKNIHTLCYIVRRSKIHD